MCFLEKKILFYIWK